MRPRIRILGKKIAARRKNNFPYLTQRAFAATVGLSTNRYQAIESKDQVGIDPERLPKFAQALGVSNDTFKADYTVSGVVDTEEKNSPAKIYKPRLTAGLRRAMVERLYLMEEFIVLDNEEIVKLIDAAIMVAALKEIDWRNEIERLKEPRDEPFPGFRRAATENEGQS